MPQEYPMTALYEVSPTSTVPPALVGGVLARVADRFHIPPAPLRWGFAAVLFLGFGRSPAGGVLLAASYCCAWALIHQAQRQATCVDRPAPVLDSADRAHLRAFTEYLWASPTTPRPLYRLRCHGFPLTGARLPERAVTTNPAFYANRMPWGQVLVYPEWLVFLTASLNLPGEVPSFRQFPFVMAEQFRLLRRYTSPLGLLMAGHAVLRQPEQRDRLRPLLSNGNSIIVPLHSVRSVRQVRHLWMPRLIVSTDAGELMLAPNGVLEITGPSFWRYQLSLLGRPWHPRLQQILAAAPAASAPGTPAAM
jgi:hypothetical protein